MVSQPSRLPSYPETFAAAKHLVVSILHGSPLSAPHPPSLRLEYLFVSALADFCTQALTSDFLLWPLFALAPFTTRLLTTLDYCVTDPPRWFLQPCACVCTCVCVFQTQNTDNITHSLRLREWRICAAAHHFRDLCPILNWKCSIRSWLNFGSSLKNKTTKLRF